MPAEFDACVRALMNDPDFHPRDENQTKKDAAYAVCVAAYKKRHKGKTPFSSSELYDDATIEDLINNDPEFRLAYLLLEADKSLWG